MNLNIGFALLCIINLGVIIWLVYPYFISHGTTLRLLKRKRDDDTFYHKIIFTYNTTNSKESAEILQKIASLISRTTKKYNIYTPSQIEGELRNENKEKDHNSGGFINRIRLFQKDKKTN
jgi:hypothetical protein